MFNSIFKQRCGFPFMSVGGEENKTVVEVGYEDLIECDGIIDVCGKEGLIVSMTAWVLYRIRIGGLTGFCI